MSESQKRAVQSYRWRLGKRGLVRFEVLGARADRALIRGLARHLAENGPNATKLRAAMAEAVALEPSKKGGIAAALLSSPLVGSRLDLCRPADSGREVVL